MTKKLVWRLGKLPSPDEVRELVKDKIITQEEAREILFTAETEKEVSEKDLKSEIKFLRELVVQLSNYKPEKIVETIKLIEAPYHSYVWYQPYQRWASTPTIDIVCSANTMDYASVSGTCTNTNGDYSFTGISTF